MGEVPRIDWRAMELVRAQVADQVPASVAGDPLVAVKLPWRDWLLALEALQVARALGAVQETLAKRASSQRPPAGR